MTKFVSMSMIGAMLMLGLGSGFAQADDRDRDGDRRRVREVCSFVTKCHRDDGRRICHREKVCKLVRVDRR
jgi:hypothetical protein